MSLTPSTRSAHAVRADPCEGLLGLQTSYYTYDRPKTTVDASVDYFPGLSDWGRHRVQINAAVRREL